MSEPLSGSGTAAALGGRRYSGCLPERISGLCLVHSQGAVCGHDTTEDFCLACAAHFLVSFIVGVLGADVMASYLVEKLNLHSTSLDALCAGTGIGGVGEDSLIHPPAGYRIAGIRAVLPSAGWRR
ncbi:putative phage holin [Escherichia coli]|uniref:Putative phage holin n=1 Tax=Escherichia coli TaxID=562 RepID=A0A376KZD1_ECOLX|nr:putative phage holin [Escherichia coli]